MAPRVRGLCRAAPREDHQSEAEEEEGDEEGDEVVVAISHSEEELFLFVETYFVRCEKSNTPYWRISIEYSKKCFIAT